MSCFANNYPLWIIIMYITTQNQISIEPLPKKFTKMFLSPGWIWTRDSLLRIWCSIHYTTMIWWRKWYFLSWKCVATWLWLWRVCYSSPAGNWTLASFFLCWSPIQVLTCIFCAAYALSAKILHGTEDFSFFPWNLHAWLKLRCVLNAIYSTKKEVLLFPL